MTSRPDLEIIQSQSNRSQSIARRQLLKILASSSVVVTGNTLLSKSWTNPVIEIGYLPAHAQSSLLPSQLPSYMYVYWATWRDNALRTIQRANLDGSGVEDLVSVEDIVEGIALDLSNSKMYWATRLGELWRSNLDGVDAELLWTRDFSSIALDVSNGKIYFTDTNGPFSSGDVWRSNLDGSAAELLVAESLGFNGIALDASNGKMYLTLPAGFLWSGDIWRANLDGTDREILIASSLGTTDGIALDLTRGKMYWIDAGSGKIQRANLDGSNVEDLIIVERLSYHLSGIALDVSNGKMYWGQSTRQANFGSIQRANLDGSGVESLVTGSFYPGKIALA